jgi:hypothetical protein
MQLRVVMAALSEAARKAFDMHPEGYQWQSEVGRTSAAKGEAEGKVEGRAEGKVESRVEAVLDILEARGLPVSGAHRTLILACTDLDLLRHRTRRAATIVTAAELFAD